MADETSGFIPGESMPIPDGWAEDSLSAFLDTALKNSFALFERRGPMYERLAAIDSTLDGFLRTAPPGFKAFFLPRAHSAWRAAVRVAISGQIPETFLLLRGVLEWLLYAAFVGDDEERARVWLRRHDNEKSRKTVREEFAAGRLRAHLSSLEPEVGRIVGELYEQCIDFGAHPNERALTGGLRREETGTWQVDYMTDFGSPALLAALKTAALVGICCLETGRILYPERFRLMGLEEKLTELKKGL